MADQKLFPEVPENLGGLSADDLTAHADAIRARITEIKEIRSAAAKGDASEEALTRASETFGELSTTEVLAQAQAAVTEFERVNDAIAAIVLEQSNLDEGLDEAFAKVTAKAEDEPEPDPDPEPETDPVVVEAPVAEVENPGTPEVETPVVEEPVVEAVPEPVMVAAAARLPRPKPEAAPLPEPEAPRHALVASAGIKGVSPGQELTRLEFADATIKALRGGTIQQGSQKVLVASVDYSGGYPDERTLMPHDSWQRTMEKIDAVTSDEAITASGGLCAPVTPYYELMNVAVADRPVRDALPAFNAVRGGLQFAAPPTIADITGVGIKTAAQDALGGTFATKSCQIVDCPDFSTVDVEMIYHCLQFGNLNARAFPEMIATYNDLVMAAHARLAEQALLDGISSFSTATTDAATYGAASTLISGILQAAAGIRNRLRMSPTARLRVLFPAWAADMVLNDIENSQFGRFDFTRDGITALLERQGVNVSWYLDTETGDGQLFSAQSAGALNPFPTTAVWYIFPEGSFLFLDAGTLDLGIVRDSVLNATNDFQIFGETFEGLAHVGPQSLKVTSTVCPSGTVANPATAITC